MPMSRRSVLVGAGAVLVPTGLLAACGSDGDAPQPAATVLPVRYGPDPAQHGRLHLPAGRGPFPVVVTVHGGGWVQQQDMAYFEPLAADLADGGVAVWNIEYRRVSAGGGWPTTLADADDATEALAGPVQEAAGGRLDLGRVHVTGHSAGGHLAAWIVGRHTLPPDAPGGQPRIHVRGAVVMAGVFDLAMAVNNGHDRFVSGLLDGLPGERPERYRIASPVEHVPVGAQVTALHGTADTTVDPAQSGEYVAAAGRAGDPARIVPLDGVGHADFGDVSTAAWRRARREILAQVHGTRG